MAAGAGLRTLDRRQETGHVLAFQCHERREADIGYFKGRLEAQRETLQQQIVSLEQAMASPDEYEEAMQEQGDDALFLRGHDDTWDQLHFARDELARVERAQARIAAGTYGVSEVSGEPVPRERLEALPTATTLVDEPPPE